MSRQQPPVTIKFQIGRNVGKYDASNTAGSQTLKTTIMEVMSRRVTDNMKVDVKKTLTRLERVVEAAYVEAVEYAANMMIGVASPRGLDFQRTYTKADGGLEKQAKSIRIGGVPVANWTALSGRTVREQNQIRGTKDSGKFFLQTGELRRQLITMARSMVKKTGSVSARILNDETQKYIKIKATDTVVTLGKFRITLLPNLYPNALPALRGVTTYNSDMKFERAIGLSEDMITKLQGPRFKEQGDLYHRPLLQPVFTYWTLFKVPKLIANQIAGNLGFEG